MCLWVFLVSSQELGARQGFVFHRVRCCLRRSLVSSLPDCGLLGLVVQTGVQSVQRCLAGGRCGSRPAQRNAVGSLPRVPGFDPQMGLVMGLRLGGVREEGCLVPGRLTPRWGWAAWAGFGWACSCGDGGCLAGESGRVPAVTGMASASCHDSGLVPAMTGTVGASWGRAAACPP